MKKYLMTLVILCLLSVSGMVFAGSVPSVYSVYITTNGGFPHFEDEDLEAGYVDVNDDDGDDVKIIHSWELDDQPIAPLIMPFEKVDGTSTNNAQDYSGYGNDGIEYGVTWSSSGGYDGNGAYIFDGSNDWINLGNDSTILLGDDDFTVTMWVKTYSNAAYWMNIMKSMPNAVKWWRIVYMPSTNKLRFTTDDNVTKRIAEATIDIDDGAWHHIAAVKIAGVGHRLYVDGTQRAISYNNGDVSNAGPVTLGKPYDKYYWNGMIDDVHMWNRALSAEQVADLANDDSDQDEVKIIVEEETTLYPNEWKLCVVPNDNADGDGTRKCSPTIITGGAIRECDFDEWEDNATFYLTNDLYDDDCDCLYASGYHDMTIDCVGYGIYGEAQPEQCGPANYGIELSDCDGATVRNCTIDYWPGGLHAWNSEDITLTENEFGNVIYPNGGAVAVTGLYSDGAYINSNTFSARDSNLYGSGLFLTSDYAEVSENTFDDNRAGAVIYSEGVVIRYNTFKNSQDLYGWGMGIYFDGATDCTVYMNEFDENGDWDIYLEDDTYDNMFYCNNFLDGGDTAYSDDDNYFTDPYENGNYWSSHTCEDPIGGVCSNTYTLPDGPSTPYGYDDRPLESACSW